MYEYSTGGFAGGPRGKRARAIVAVLTSDRQSSALQDVGERGGWRRRKIEREEGSRSDGSDGDAVRRPGGATKQTGGDPGANGQEDAEIDFLRIERASQTTTSLVSICPTLQGLASEICLPSVDCVLVF